VSNVDSVSAFQLFLPRDAMLAPYMLSSCAHPSVTCRYYAKTGKRRITQ